MPRPQRLPNRAPKPNYPEEKSPNISSSGFTRFYGRATQALRGMVVSRNSSNSNANNTSSSSDNHGDIGDGASNDPGSGSNTATTTSKPSKKNMTRRGANQGGSSSTPPPSSSQPIPIDNANSDSTGVTTTNPSVTSGLSLSSSSSGSNELESRANVPTTTGEGSRKAKRRGVVHLEDIPGSRVGPDDGPWPKEYEILETEDDLWRELRSLARPHRAVFVNYESHRSRSRSHSRGNRSRSHGRSAERREVGELPGEPLTPVQESPVVDSAVPTSPVAAVEETPTVELPRVNVVDSVNFQPCKTLKTQDRYVVTQLEVHGEMWTLTGVFDGHLGDVTVEHVAHHLPIIIREFLKSKLPADFCSSEYDPEHVSHLFQSAIAAFDDAIAHDILDLFGGSVDQLSNYTDADIRKVINDNHHGQGLYGGPRGPATASGENWRKARLCMYGTTALVALMDPKGEGVWVANLGDCMGILVTRTVALDDEDEESDSEAVMTKLADPEQGEWTVEVLTTMHNGDNDKELERIRSEHPGEEDTCIMDRRVLGALAPTRCLGDIPFKQPPEFTRRVLYNLYPFVHNTAPWEEFLKHNKTPPYLSSQAEVAYRRIKGDDLDQPPPLSPTDPTQPQGKRRGSGSISAAVIKRLGSMTSKRGRKAKKQAGAVRVKKQRFLILASDGFTDLCMSRGGVKKVVTSWAKEMVAIGSPRHTVQETEAKLRDRANGVLEDEEQDRADPVTIPVPRLANPTQISSSHFAFGDTESSPTPVSPVSATSPVPFTANSYSSSSGSLVIPTVSSPGPDHEETMSGMSTPAYAFSIPPTRAASPMSQLHLGQPHSPSSHPHAPISTSPLSRTQSSGQIHSSPLLQSTPQPSSIPGVTSDSHMHLSPILQPHATLAPTPAPAPLSVPVPRLHRPPLPHTNRSYHCTSSSNMALRLLRCALSGEERDNDRVAKAMTIDMDVSWLDDTAIVVVGL
ncbi:protein serine/threonine phosphatase 2C [Coprinellus micaceus]|uniref:Protein serine/threonine phosphatase 2C n=1 Tax=Coprinellus micaceus TaxID=71717 RepID=A0A4Y7TCX7_COPMI|nr:protein serine/threonine phosphatase 2C [Coprinellus micaceus]